MQHFYGWRERIWEQEGKVRHYDRLITEYEGREYTQTIVRGMRTSEVELLQDMRTKEVDSILRIYGTPKVAVDTDAHTLTHRFNDVTGWSRGNSSP